VPRRAPAGSFRELRAVGRVAAGGLRITTTHRFRARDIEIQWEIRCRGRCRGRTVDVHLPTWGADAVIDVHARDGTHAPLTSPVASAGVERVELGAAEPGPDAETGALAGEAPGYVATPLSRPPGATLLPVATAPQPTDPNPGPTLAIRLVAGAPFEATSLTVRLSPR